jgi:photosystem II stability/assembly factor-like uncharacterized protein
MAASIPRVRFLTSILAGLLVVIRAGAATWTPIGPEGGGFYKYDLAVAPTDPSLVFGGSFGGLFKSSDGAASWSPSDAQLQPESIAEIVSVIPAVAVDPQNASIVYASRSQRGIARSTDGGATWTTSGRGLGKALFAYVLVVNPVDPNVLYTVTSRGVFKSKNAGTRWRHATGGLRGVGVFTLILDPVNPETVYAVANQQGVYKSINGGRRWLAVNSGIAGQYVQDLAVDPATPTNVYVATFSGIFKSTDAGATWVPSSSGLSQLGTTAVAIDPTAPLVVYAATAAGVFRSPDGGANWSQVSVSGLSGQYISRLVLDSSNPPVLYALEDGVVKSVDGGVTWTLSMAGFRSVFANALAFDPAAPATVYTASQIGNNAFTTTDGGTSWSATPVTGSGLFVLPRVLATDPSNGMTVYAGGETGEGDPPVFKSTDGGASWSPSGTGITSEIAQVLLIDPTSPSTIYAATYDGGVFKSTDGGGLWTSLATSPQEIDIQTMVMDPVNTSTLYLGTEGSGVHKTTDGGVSWTQKIVGLTNPTDPFLVSLRNLAEESLAIDPQNPATLFLGTLDGVVFKTTDGADNWVKMTTLPSFRPHLVVDPSDSSVVYAGTDGAGVFRSADGGVTWSALNTGLDSSVVLALGFAPGPGGKLFAGTAHSVFRLDP